MRSILFPAAAAAVAAAAAASASPAATSSAVAAVSATATSSAPPPNICGTNSSIGNAVVAALNLTYPGLEAVAAAAQQGDLNGACQALADYYQQGNSSSWLRIPPVTPGTTLAGGVVDEMVFNDTFYLAGVDITAPVPRNADGGLNWTYKGPRDDVEFMNCLNRHDSFGYLLAAWRQTGNPIYINYFDALVRDWALHNPCPDALSGGKTCVPAGLPGTPCSWAAETTPGAQACATGTMESPWRSLEMGIRTGGIWPVAFFGFQQAANFSTSARALFVLAVSEHNAALTVDGGHPGQGTPNWECVQWQGLISSAVTFPELKNASGLLAYALAELEAVLHETVYPDGIETEQASGYDMMTAGNYFNTLQFLAEAGDAEPPQTFHDAVEAMWTYGAYVADNQGCMPRNGDSDLCGSGYDSEMTAYFKRPDWTYVRSHGAQGSLPPTYPTQGPSYAFPWAGQIALRSGYDSQATWVWFDVGPYGSSGHAHRDKLQIMLHARGSMLLADSGRFAYAGTDLSATLHVEYGRNTTAHNTLTFDGCDQLATPAVATAPAPPSSILLTPQADAAFGNMSFYDGLAGSLLHTRGIYYARAAAQWKDPKGLSGGVDGDYLVVVDAVTTDRPRTVQATWHTHPNATVTVDAATGATAVVGANASSGQPTTAQVCVIPAAAAGTEGGAPVTPSWSQVTTARGQYQNTANGTRWQGWYSQSYDDAWPSTTVLYEAAGVWGGSGAGSSALFAWLIIPTATAAGNPCSASSAKIVGMGGGNVTVAVVVAGQGSFTVSVPVGLAA